MPIVVETTRPTNVGGQIKVANATPTTIRIRKAMPKISMIGQYKGSNPINPPILSRTKVNSDMKEMDNTLPMETKATIIVPTGTNDTIETTESPILITTKSS